MSDDEPSYLYEIEVKYNFHTHFFSGQLILREGGWTGPKTQKPKLNEKSRRLGDWELIIIKYLQYLHG